MGKFDALTEFRKPDAATKGREPTSNAITESTNAAQTQTRGPGPGRPTGKRSNPDYEQVTILVRKQTRKQAVRLLEDTEANQDFSELVEDLLSKWIVEQS